MSARFHRLERRRLHYERRGSCNIHVRRASADGRQSEPHGHGNGSGGVAPRFNDALNDELA